MGKTQQEPLIAVRLCDSTSIVWCHQVRRDTCNDACLPRAACAWQGEWGRETEGKRALDEKGAGWLVGVLRCARIGYRKRVRVWDRTCIVFGAGLGQETPSHSYKQLQKLVCCATSWIGPKKAGKRQAAAGAAREVRVAGRKHGATMNVWQAPAWWAAGLGR